MITIYGSSDDLIELEGAVEAEFYCYTPDEEEPVYLAFSDGTLLSVCYSSLGIWRFQCVVEGLSDFSKVEGTDDDLHSDKITLDGPITWAILGSELAR